MAVYERHRPESTVLYQSVAMAWPKIEIEYAVIDQSISNHMLQQNLRGADAAGCLESLIFSKRDFVDRLAGVIPSPWFNLTRFHGSPLTLLRC